MFEPQAALRGGAMEQLNGPQREAVTAGPGPLLVVAGAGSGKTLTLACRVGWLIESGARPERLLLLTFTRRAAREMLSRAEQATGQPTGKVWGGTFHAVANRLLRLHGRAVGLRPDFTVMDQADAADLMNLIRGDLRLGTGERRFPRKETLAAIYSRTVNAGATLAVVLERDFPWCAEEADGIRSIFETYTRRKREQNVLDYDDLLLYWSALGRTPGAGARMAGLFDHILVDEYQDTNALQADILRSLWPVPAQRDGSLMVVGDDAQAIYSFRSATNRNILEFPKEFPGARVVKLEQNFRSTPPILEVSNAVIALSAERHEKTLWSARPGARRPVLTTCLDEAEQSDEVCRLVLDHREQGTPLKRQAVLFRAAHHSDLLEVELARRNIPFVKYGGLRFLEAAHVKDVLSLLRILENPWDEVAWFRVLQLLDGIGPATARRLMAALEVRRSEGVEPVRSPVRRLIESPPPVPASAREEAEALRSALADCAAPEGEIVSTHTLSTGLSPAVQIERLRRFCEPVFRRRYSSPSSRLKDVEQLEALAGRFSTRGAFIADLTLDPPSSTEDLAGPPLLDEDYLILSTIHSAKGLEWDVVHVIHAADGMIPSDMATGSAEAIEEERRLLYVAMTRARDVLYVHFPLRYYRRPRGLEDPHGYAQLTRFIPESVRGVFDLRSPYLERGEDPAVPPGAGGMPADVDAYLSGLWDSPRLVSD